MRRVIGGMLAILLALVAVGGPIGCGGSKDSTTNPDLKVPTIPDSDRGGKGGAKTGGGPTAPPR